MSPDRFIQVAGERFRVRVQLKTGQRVQIGNFATRDEARAARDAFLADNASVVPRTRQQANRLKNPVRTIIHERRAALGSPWAVEWRDLMMRERYEMCDDLDELAHELGVTKLQLYSRAKTLGIMRKSSVVDSARRYGLSLAQQRRAENRRLNVYSDNVEKITQRVAQAPNHDTGLVATALRNMPPLQAAMHAGWRSDV